MQSVTFEVSEHNDYRAWSVYDLGFALLMPARNTGQERGDTTCVGRYRAQNATSHFLAHGSVPGILCSILKIEIETGGLVLVSEQHESLDDLAAEEPPKKGLGSRFGVPGGVKLTENCIIFWDLVAESSGRDFLLMMRDGTMMELEEG